MANPVSTNPALTLPPVSSPVVDATTGIWSQQWYRVIVGLYQRLGGTQGLDISSIQAAASSAQTEANNAATLATTANTAASVAQSTANTAEVQAATAASNASAALSVAKGLQSSAMQRSNNLSDVVNATTARSNLGINTFPVSFYFAGNPTSSQTIYVPVVRAMTVVANFSGAKTYCGGLPTANALYTVSYIRSGLTTVIGSITLNHTAQTFTAVGAATSLQPGDALICIAPSATDGTMTDVGISLLMTLA